MLNDEPLTSRDFDQEFRELIPKLRECRTPEEVIGVLAPRLPTDSFEAVWNFRRRGNNRRQVRYFLARLTAYVEIGCGKQNESESYLDGNKWHIEHLWPDHPEWHVSDYTNPIEFSLARSRIGALTLLPGRDNESYNDLNFVEKAKHYGRQPNLTAILSPDHRLYNSMVNEFIAKNDIKGLFHDFGPSAPIPTVIESRTRLYQVLATRVWDPSRLGLPLPSQAEETLIPSRPARKPRPTPNRRTDLARLVKAGVVAAGTQLMTETGNYSATVDKDGIIWLPTGDAFVAVDEAGKAVSGARRCDGLGFWHVQTPRGLLPLRTLRDQAYARGGLGRKSRRR
jgi:hypothetical protein